MYDEMKSGISSSLWHVLVKYTVVAVVNLTKDKIQKYMHPNIHHISIILLGRCDKKFTQIIQLQLTLFAISSGKLMLNNQK